jgi:hypothetical protein
MEVNPARVAKIDGSVGRPRISRKKFAHAVQSVLTSDSFVDTVPYLS